jgi:MFS family permease
VSKSQQVGSFGENMRFMLRAFRGRNYVLFFLGQGLSLIGTWMQNTALPMLAYQLRGQTSDLGMVGFFSAIPGFLVGPFAGVFSDRWNRRKVLVVTQALSLVQASLLAVLTLSGAMQIWHLMALGAFMGLINAFDIPTRQSFVVQMVEDKEHLPNAIALNSFMFNGARFVGPFLAGTIIPLANGELHFRFAGYFACFVLNAVSYLAVIGSLLAMRLKPYLRRKTTSNVLQSLREGFGYAFHFRPIRAILLMLGTISLLMTAYGTLLPALDSKALHHYYPPPGAKTGAEPVSEMDKMVPPLTTVFGWRVGYARSFSLMVSAVAVGGLIGALYLSQRRSVVGLTRVIASAAGLLGLGMIGLAVSPSLPFSLAMLLLVGLGGMIQMASSNTLLQTLVEEEKRGRVMSFYTMSFQGTAPFGALAAGWAAVYLGQYHGEQITIAIAGGLIILAAGVFLSRLPALRKDIRPIYVKMGILSENAPVSREAATQDIEGTGGVGK